MTKNNAAIKVRKARISDVPEVHGLINGAAKKHEIIPRSLNDLYENLRDIFVCENSVRIVGACALHVLWEDLAEIRSLAVKPKLEGKGVGKRLVRSAIREARKLGIERVFALTYYPEYFISQFGFKEIDKAKLPHKIWGDCVKCHKFPDCDETAVIKKF